MATQFTVAGNTFTVTNYNRDGTVNLFRRDPDGKTYNFPNMSQQQAIGFGMPAALVRAAWTPPKAGDLRPTGTNKVIQADGSSSNIARNNQTGLAPATPAPTPTAGTGTNTTVSPVETSSGSPINVQQYLRANPDLVAAFASQDPQYVPPQYMGDISAYAAWHYNTHGKNEGRPLQPATGTTDEQIEAQFQTVMARINAANAPQAPQYDFSAPDVAAFGGTDTSLTPEQEARLQAMRNGIGDNAATDQEIEAARRAFVRKNQAAALGFSETAYTAGDGGTEYTDVFALLPFNSRTAAEKYAREHRNATPYEVLKGIGLTDQDIGYLTASRDVRKASDPAVKDEAAIANLQSQLRPEAFASIAEQSRMKPEEITRQMAGDLARYGINDIRQVGSYTTSTGDTVFFNRANGQLLPATFGSDMTGKGGKDFEFVATENGGAVPVPKWVDTSQKDEAVGFLSVLAVPAGGYAGEFLGAGVGAGQAAAAGTAAPAAGLGYSGMTTGAIVGGGTGAVIGGVDGIQGALRGGLTGAAIGAASGAFSDYMNDAGLFAPEGGSGSFMDPSQTWQGQTAALPPTQTQLAGDSVYNLATGLGSAGPIGAGSGSLNLPGGAGFNASMGTSNPNTFNADTVNYTTGVGTASGTPLGTSPTSPNTPSSPNQPTNEQQPAANEGAKPTFNTGNAALDNMLNGLTMKELIGLGLTAGGAIGGSTVDDPDIPDLPGVGDIGTGGGGGVGGGGAIQGMLDAAERDRMIREGAADQIAPYLADWLEQGRNASATLNETAGLQRDLAQQQADTYRNSFAPVVEKTASEAMRYGLADDQERRARRASQESNAQSNAAIEAASARLEDMGIDPSSARYFGANLGARINAAGQAAGAANSTREQVRDKGVALRSNAAQLGQNINQAAQAGLSSSADTTAKSASVQQPSIAGAISTGEFKAGNPSAYMQPFQTAIQADLGLKGIQASLYNSDSARAAAESQGWGNLFGTGLGLLFGG